MTREKLIEDAKDWRDKNAGHTKYFPRMDNFQHLEMLADFALEQIANRERESQAKIENLQEQLNYYQNVTEKDIENIAEGVTADILDLLVDGEDVPVKIQTKVAASIHEWFQIAGEDQS